MSSHVSIAAGDRIPFLQKIMFSSGVTVDYVINGLLTTLLWMPYFNIGLGISPALLGMVLMIMRGWNAFLDLAMGNISDNFRSRWGRRRPFMAVGAVIVALTFPWIYWVPPHWSEAGQIAYLIVMGIIFFTCYSSWSMPFYALQLELTPSYDERTRLAAWMTFFAKGSAFLGGWVLAVLTGAWFLNPATGKPDLVHAVRVFSWFLAAIILIFGLLPPLFVKERFYASETSRQPRDPFWQSIRESMHCRPLLLLVGITFFLVLGGNGVSALGQYVIIYFINGGHLSHAFVLAGWISSTTFTAGILSIPFWTWMSEKFDKKNIVGILIAGDIFSSFLTYFCQRPDLPYLLLIPALFQSMVIAAIWLFVPSMKADVADYDELQTSRRREGALNAFFSWFYKAALTVGAGMGGVLIQISGFSAKLMQQPPAVLQHMRLIFLCLPVFLWSFALIFIWYYPLDRKRMAEIRTELEKRRGKV